METRHLEGNPDDNRLSKIKWGTPQENHQDKIRHGRATILRGEKRATSKLTEKEVVEIRQRYKGPNHRFRKIGPTSKELAIEYGVSDHLIRLIVSGKAWTHV